MTQVKNIVRTDLWLDAAFEARLAQESDIDVKRIVCRTEAQTAAAILGYNHQSSPFYQDSFNLLKNNGLSPESKGNSWLASVYRQMIKGEWL